MGPEFFPIFIQADLLMGAVLEARFVVGVVSLAYWVVVYIAVLDRFDHRIRPVANKIPFLKEGNELTFLAWLSAIATFSFVVSVFFLQGENFVWIATLSAVLAIFSHTWLLINYVDEGRFSITLCLSALLSTQGALSNFGKYQAIEDLNHPKARYSVTADDKNYVNVILLRASEAGVLLRVGETVVLYDRSKVSKIELAVSEMKQY